MDYNSEELVEILNIFKVESEEIIQEFNDNFLALEKNPFDKTPIKKLIQIAHSLKGSARMLGFNSIQDIVHKIEDVLFYWEKENVVIKCDFHIIYHVCDFLSELINLSVQKKSNYVDDNVMKVINDLDNIITGSLGDEKGKEKSKLNIIVNSLTDIKAIILELMFVLEQSDNEKTNDDINEIILVVSEDLNQLHEIFQKTENKEIKEKISTILKYVNNKKDVENNEFLKNCQIMVNDLNNDIYNLYKEMHISIKLKNEPAIKKEEPIVKNEVISAEVDIISNFDFVLTNLGRIKFEKDYIKILNEKLEEIISKIKNKKIELILSKTLNILKLFMERKNVVDNDCYIVILQCVYLAKRLALNEKEENLNNLNFLMQRLNVVEDMLNLSKYKEKTLVNVKHEEDVLNQSQVRGFKESINPIEIQEIKTLRVDTSKLDTLIGQTGELLISGIKTKEHINEIVRIINKITHWNSVNKKIINYLRYLEKKGFFIYENEENGNLFYKKIQGFFNDNSETIVEIHSDLNQLYKVISEDDNKLHQTVMEIENIAKGIRVLPLATIFHSFPRMIRDLANEYNKKIEFIVTGSDTTVDKKIIEEIKIPLIHILRNSVSHGIEKPEQRIKNNKSETGIIKLTAKQIENNVIITIEDDGYGINIDKVKQTALNKGLLTTEEIDNMDNEQIMKLLFLPGFSTEESITDIAGRGIGLDIVKTKINNLNGEILVDSVLNEGCKVSIKLPVSMSTIKTFVIVVNDQKYAIPVNSVKVIKQITKDKIYKKCGQDYIVFEDHSIPIFSIANVLGDQNNSNRNEDKPLTSIIIENQEMQAAFIVDKLMGDQEVFHKKLIAPIIKIKNISGFTTLATGEICLILNPYEILRNTISKPNF